MSTDTGLSVLAALRRPGHPSCGAWTVGIAQTPDRFRLVDSGVPLTAISGVILSPAPVAGDAYGPSIGRRRARYGEVARAGAAQIVMAKVDWWIGWVATFLLFPTLKPIFWGFLF